MRLGARLTMCDSALGESRSSGNCRNTDGRIVAVPRERVALVGTVELRSEPRMLRPAKSGSAEVINALSDNVMPVLLI
jgi:hypothetical protein